jgi:hypothetical protein
MNKGLKHFKMHKTPVPVLEQHPLAISGYQTAKKFGCEGTRREAHSALTVSVVNNKNRNIFFIV